MSDAVEVECWDVYDSAGNRTGRLATRGVPLGDGEYHLVAHIWVSDGAGNYLIQKRSATLAWQPGIWATTGGSVIAGEDSLHGALRETEEEIGIRLAPHQLTFLGRLIRHDTLSDTWMAHADAAQVAQVRLCPEVDEIAWRSLAGILDMVRRGEFFDYGQEYFGQLP